MSKTSRRNNRHRNKSHSAGHTEQPSAQPQPISSVVTPVQFPQTENGDSGEQARTKARREKIDFALRVIASFAAIIGIPVIFAQSCANWRQAKAAERQLLLDERAWVTPYDYRKTNGIYRVLFKNTGKTPALNVDVDARSTEIINNIETAKWPPNPPGPYSGVLGPNMDGHAETEPGTLYSGGRYFFGRIWYDDIFSNRHWDDFCVFFDPNPFVTNGFVVTKFGNATDDSQTNQTR